MIRRPVMAVALLSAAILPFAGLTPALAAKPRVTFPRKVLSPKTAKGGASVTALVRVAATGGATVSSVTLRLVRGGTQLSSTAMNRSGSDWSRSFSAPANTGAKSANVDVWADAQTSLGLKSTKIGTLKVSPSPVDPNSPPPPPPI